MAAAVSLLGGALVVSGSMAAAAGPTITSFSPTSGPVGTKVTINGSGFTPGPVKVSFHGVNAPGPKVNSAGTQIIVHVPPLASTGTLAVITPHGGTQSTEPFHVTFGASISKHKLFRGQSFRISGSAFPPNTDVLITLDGNRFAGIGTDVNGNFTLVRLVPPNINPGPSHTLDISCANHVCAPLGLVINIFSDWPSGRYDPGQSADNSPEWILGLSNLNKLTGNPIFHAAVGNYYGPVVEGDGYVYVANASGTPGADYHLQALQDGGNGYWEAITDGPLTGAPVVAGNRVYVVTSDTLYAFHITFNTAYCPEFNVCNPVWTAPVTSPIGNSPANPYAPIVADGQVYVAGRNGILYAFDANGVTNCSGIPTVCQPLWTQLALGTTLYGPPAVSPASAGGNGDVYVTIKGSGKNELVAFHSDGLSDYVGDVLPATSLSAPAMRNGRIVVSAWDSTTSTATLFALSQSGGHVLWQSIGLGGGMPAGVDGALAAPALTSNHAFAVNSLGRLYAFKFSACTASPCQPDWRSVQEGAGFTDPPTVANGVVYMPANTQTYSGNRKADIIYAFDALGATNCSGTPKTCSDAWNSVVGRVDPLSQVSVFAGQLWSVGLDYATQDDLK